VLPLALWPLRCHDVRLHRLEHEPQARRQADVSLLHSLYIYIYIYNMKLDGLPRSAEGDGGRSAQRGNKTFWAAFHSLASAGLLLMRRQGRGTPGPGVAHWHWQPRLARGRHSLGLFRLKLTSCLRLEACVYMGNSERLYMNKTRRTVLLNAKPSSCTLLSSEACPLWRTCAMSAMRYDEPRFLRTSLLVTCVHFSNFCLHFCVFGFPVQSA
jgi:hypothetical protein